MVHTPLTLSYCPSEEAMVWWIVEGYPEGIQFSNFPSTNWIPWSPRLTFRSACPLRRKVGKRPLAAWL